MSGSGPRRASRARHRRRRLAKPAALAACVAIAASGAAVAVDRTVGPGVTFAVVGGDHSPRDGRQGGQLARADAAPSPAAPEPSGDAASASPSPAASPRGTASPISRSETRPTISAAPTPANSPRAAARPDSVADQVVRLVNARRAEAGCVALRIDPRLVRSAAGHSADMASRDYFAHDTPEGVTFVDRERNAGYPDPGGENIAAGQRGPDEVMTAWMNSPGHRANILNCSFRAIGVGEAAGSGRLYWTQDFGYS